MGCVIMWVVCRRQERKLRPVGVGRSRGERAFDGAPRSGETIGAIGIDRRTRSSLPLRLRTQTGYGWCRSCSFLKRGSDNRCCFIFARTKTGTVFLCWRFEEIETRIMVSVKSKTL